MAHDVRPFHVFYKNNKKLTVTTTRVELTTLGFDIYSSKKESVSVPFVLRHLHPVHTRTHARTTHTHTTAGFSQQLSVTINDCIRFGQLIGFTP